MTSLVKCVAILAVLTLNLSLAVAQPTIEQYESGPQTVTQGTYTVNTIPTCGARGCHFFVTVRHGTEVHYTGTHDTPHIKVIMEDGCLKVENTGRFSGISDLPMYVGPGVTEVLCQIDGTWKLAPETHPEVFIQDFKALQRLLRNPQGLNGIKYRAALVKAEVYTIYLSGGDIEIYKAYSRWLNDLNPEAVSWLRKAYPEIRERARIEIK
jgi:hypothetical protein